METRSRRNQPEQPPKQAAYSQESNPVSQTLQEKRASAPQTREHGDSLPSITRRAADLKPSGEENKPEKPRTKDSPDVDLEYGVEQQPAEGYIADSVQRKGMGVQRAQAGAHAGPVGSAAGPGHPGFGEEGDLAANMDQKRARHDRMLGDRVGHSPPEPENDVAEREAVRQRKLKQDEKIDVGGAVKEATGTPVV